MDYKKLKKSFHFALMGIHHAIHSDQNVVIHLIVSCIVIIAGILLGLSSFEMAILGLTMIIVITTEMVNTAIEKVIDLIIQEHHINAKIAKDVASGMVLISAVGAFVVGILIFFPHVIKLFR